MSNLLNLGTSPLLKWANHRRHRLMVGDPVTVRSHLSPMSGQAGRIAEITPTDLYGPYLVWFDGGLQFRYQRRELALTNIDKSARTDR